MHTQTKKEEVGSRSGTNNDGHEICLKLKRKEKGWVHLPWVQFFQSEIKV
jgi:hypothetical protein